MKILICMSLLLMITIYGPSQGINYLDEKGRLINFEDITQTDYVKGEVLIKFKENSVDEHAITELLKGSRIKVKNLKIGGKTESNNDSKSFFDDFSENFLKKFINSNLIFQSQKGVNRDLIRLMILEINKDKDITNIITKLESYPEVEYAEPNFILTLNDSPPSDLHVEQRGFEQPSDMDIDANRAWDFSTGNYSIKVGVVDNGVDYHNIDLGNGTYGIDGAIVRGGWDYYNNDANPDDDDNGNYSHGTPVAGIIAANRNNGNLVAGLAGGNGTAGSSIQLFAFKVGQGQSITTDLAIEAIIEASTNTPSGYGCHVLNNSWGGTNYNESMRRAVSIAARNNVVFVASKGNIVTANRHYPSDYDGSWVISVGATDSQDNRSVWCCGQSSNTGFDIDVAAPGGGGLIENVYTTATVENGSVQTFGGTSAAAPHVAGLASLILSEAIEQGKSLHHEDIEGIIEASSEDVNHATLPGYDDELGHGRINAGRALEYMNQPWEITHQLTIGGTIVNSTDWYQAIFYGDYLSDGPYLVKRHEVETAVTLPNFLNTNIHIWGRGTNASTGWSAANPNYQLGFCDVVAVNGNEAILHTFIYEVKTISGQFLGWYPTIADNVAFAYTTLGVGCPENRIISQNISPGTEAGTIIYSASNSITATNKVESGSDVVYTATTSIKLSSGFEVENEASFSVYIGGCSRGGILKSTEISTMDTLNSIHELRKIEIYPNPFHDYVSINFYVEHESDVSIWINDINGNLISVLLDSHKKKKGWHSCNFGKSNLPPGVYVYTILIGNVMETGKIIKI